MVMVCAGLVQLGCATVWMMTWQHCDAVPDWPVVVAPNGEILATAVLRDRAIQLQVDTGSAVSWVAAEGCELRDVDPDTYRETYFGQLHERVTLPPDASVEEHSDACDALAETGMRIAQVSIGSRVVVQRSEALIAGCVAHRGKEWGSVSAKRRPRLGTTAIVRKVDTAAGKEAVKLRFEADGETMWWRPEFLQPAHPFPLGWRPEHEGDTDASECLALHYADNTDVIGSCTVLNISYFSARGGRAKAPAGLLFGVARLVQEEVHPQDGFDRPGLAWDGMLGLAPPHPKHRAFERRYLARARSGPSGKGNKQRTSHSLVESILRSRGGEGVDEHTTATAASYYTLELGPWPTGETDWPRSTGSSGWEEEAVAAVVAGVPGNLKMGFATGPATVVAATSRGTALGPVSVLKQQNLDNKGTYWKVAATHLTLEVLEGTWLGGGWGEGGVHEQESEDSASNRVVRSIPVYAAGAQTPE